MASTLQHRDLTNQFAQAVKAHFNSRFLDGEKRVLRLSIYQATAEKDLIKVATAKNFDARQLISEFHRYIQRIEVEVGLILIAHAETAWTSTAKYVTELLPDSWLKLGFDQVPQIALQESRGREYEARKPRSRKSRTTQEAAKEMSASRKRIIDAVKSSDWRLRLRKWSRRITNNDKVAKTIARGRARGWNNKRIEREVAKYVNGYASSARRIVRTEMSRLDNIAAEDAWEQLSNVIQGFQIINPLDESTRPSHGKRAGRIYWKDKRRKYNDANRPALPDEANCRCTYVPVLRAVEASDLERGPDVTTATYHGWFAKQSAATKRRIVGTGRWNVVQRKITGENRKPSWFDFVEPTTGTLLSVDALQSETRGQSLRRRQRSLKTANLQQAEAKKIKKANAKLRKSIITRAAKSK